MIIEVPKISEEGSTYESVEEGVWDDLSRDPCIDAFDDLYYRLFVEIVGNEILVRGVTAVQIQLVCSKCGEIFSTMLEDSSFLRAYEFKPGLFELDITGDLRESLLLKLPAHPVCRTDCQGLCPDCGVNLNQDVCSCKPETGDGRWSSLDNLSL